MARDHSVSLRRFGKTGKMPAIALLQETRAFLESIGV